MSRGNCKSPREQSGLTMIVKYLWWLVPILAMAILTPFISDWDMKLETYYYQNHFTPSAFDLFLYNYAIYPAQVVAIIALIVFLVSFLVPTWKKWRKPCLVLILTMVVGAGFVVHTLLKDQWGRPRPKQVVEFGGKQPFRPYYIPNFHNSIETSKSFPCGHCTMGFYFFALAFVFRRMGYIKLTYAALLFALFLGFGLGLTRMAQGGHFLSDVLMTGLIMWLIAGAFDWLIYSEDQGKLS